MWTLVILLFVIVAYAVIGLMVSDYLHQNLGFGISGADFAGALWPLTLYRLYKVDRLPGFHSWNALKEGYTGRKQPKETK